MDTKLTISGAPHWRSKISVDLIMWVVVISLIPSAVSAVYFFGMPAFITIIVSVAAALITDIAMQKLMHKKISLLNGSSAITGLLFALIIPPAVPVWITVLGVVFAVSIGKYAFGPGNNIFNPALIGRAFIAISFPAVIASAYLPAKHSIDAVTSATPLAIAKSSGIATLVSSFGSKTELYRSLFFGNISGSLGETSALAILLGAALLLYLKIIDYRIPLVYLGTVFVGALLFDQDPLFHLLAGGLLIGAFFMATDYVTIPLTSKGRLIFAFGCGALTLLFRIVSEMPEGVMYSVLLMNITVPLIDRYTKNKPFGYKERRYKDQKKIVK